MDPVLAQLVEHLTVVVLSEPYGERLESVDVVEGFYFPGIKWSLVQFQQTGFFIYIFNTYKSKK